MLQCEVPPRTEAARVVPLAPRVGAFVEGENTNRPRTLTAALPLRVRPRSQDLTLVCFQTNVKHMLFHDE